MYGSEFVGSDGSVRGKAICVYVKYLNNENSDLCKSSIATVAYPLMVARKSWYNCDNLSPPNTTFQYTSIFYPSAKSNVQARVRARV